VLLVGLLIIALVCLAVGLVLPSVAWLIASLIATAGAGYLLVKARSTILAPPSAAGAGEGPADAGTPDLSTVDAGSVAADATAILPRIADDTRDRPAGSDHAGPEQDGSAHVGSGPGAGDDIGGVRTAAQPLSAGSAVAGTDYVAGPDDVWVIDGRPRYHLLQCVIIQGQDAEPIPFDQAIEDGFMPCSLCEPQLVRAAIRGTG
jgi:hypothetical protein